MPGGHPLILFGFHLQGLIGAHLVGGLPLQGADPTVCPYKGADPGSAPLDFWMGNRVYYSLGAGVAQW